jgi:hypothetical protein
MTIVGLRERILDGELRESFWGFGETHNYDELMDERILFQKKKEVIISCSMNFLRKSG